MMRPSFKIFTAGLLLACAPAPAAQPLRHLFLDPSFVEQSGNTTIRVNPAQQRETVIRADKPWEKLMISLFLTVLDDGGKLRMWYICRDSKNVPNVAYAESADGINWTKPDLGIVDYEGSKKNNLVGLSSLEGTVFRDETAPPEKRYNYITHHWEKGGGMLRYHSPDGLHWSRDEELLVKFGADSQAVTFWDEQAGKYALYLRGWETRDDKKRYRTVVRAELSSLTVPLTTAPSDKTLFLWGKEKPPVIGDEFPTVLETDADDPPNSDVYNISAQPYPPDPRWYIGFPSFFQREKHTSDGRLDVQFIGSRDGYRWHRYDRASYARPGLAGSESANMVFMGPWIVMRGEEIWQYGTGFHSRHGDKEARKVKTDGVIFRYVQRMDGFVSLNFEDGGGTALTQPVTVDGARLALNLDTDVLGHLQAGICDAEGNPVEGFGLEDSEVLRTNSTQALLKWKNGADLSSLKGQKVRLSLKGERAKLFSFYFTD